MFGDISRSPLCTMNTVFDATNVINDTTPITLAASGGQSEPMKTSYFLSYAVVVATGHHGMTP